MTRNRRVTLLAMIEIGPARECEMVFAFLRAEVDSPRFAGHVEAALRGSGYSARIIRDANLENERENEIRRTVLARYRGYGCNTALFAGFSADAAWRRVELLPTELACLLYAREPSWIQMSDETRRPDRVVEKMRRGENIGIADSVRTIQEQLEQGKEYSELIAAEGTNGTLILIEGHMRATGYIASALEQNLKLIVASSPTMNQWHYY